MSRIYEEDVLDAGKSQVIIDNGSMRAIIVPELGGRIADVQFSDGRDGFETRPYLYRTYPEGVNFGPYTEYGGIEECVGGAPGALWNARWRWDRKDDGVLLQALSKRVLVRKFVSLDEAEPVIKIEYSFLNFGNSFSRFTFGVHPEVCMGGSLKDNRYHIPTEEEMLVGQYVEPGFKDKILPSEGWCAITCEGEVFGQMFPKGVIDILEIYYPKVDTHMVLEPIIFGVGISPDKYAGFTYMIYMGDGDAEKIREVRASRNTEFSVSYEPFDRTEVPEDVMADLEETVRDKSKDELKDILALRSQAGAGVIKIDDAVVKGSFGSVTNAVDMKFVPGPDFRFVLHPSPTVEAEQTGRIDDVPQDMEISVEHVKGNIAIHGWEHSYIEYANMRGNIIRSEGVVRFETTGDYSLRIPGGTRVITLNFVDGNVTVFDVASSLKITGVNGKVDVVSAEVPDDGTLDISLVNGDIDLTIPNDSSCEISAASLSGEEIVCDLPLREEERTRTQLGGVLNDGRAKIILSAAKGKISIGIRE